MITCSRNPKYAWLGAALLALGGWSAAGATVDLQGQIVLRPVTPSEAGDYSLPAGIEYSGGLSTTPVGAPVYLEVQINGEVPAADIVSVTWALTSRPGESSAVLTASPLGPNVPAYLPPAYDAVAGQVAGRAVLRPDARGSYTVSATITTASSGTTNVSRTLTAGVYMGLKYCMYCHSGHEAPNMESWADTPHASMFRKSIDAIAPYGGHYSKNCISCHTVGYNANTNAVNGGFDDVAAELGWTLPAVLTNGNWAALPDKLKQLANIQCENCHGPGSEHAWSLGDPALISVDRGAGNCGQCHDAKTHHVKVPEWKNSRHAVVTSHPSGPGEESCVGCHTGIGFSGRMSGSPVIDTTYESITCVACHDPHDSTHPHQLRASESVTLKDGMTVTNAGAGALCIQCHQSRQNASQYVETASASSRFGPHHGPQGDIFLGRNAVTYGKDIPSSAHRDAIGDSCVTCHMQANEYGQPGFLKAGGHTFNMATTDENGNEVLMTEACAQCHGKIETFNLAREDYDGDGVVEGVQTEVRHLMDQLALLLPPVGQPKASLSINSSFTRQQLRAAYNYVSVLEDRSYGVHNAAYTVGILKASIADLTGNAGATGPLSAQDLQYYTWAVQNFGSASTADAARDASPAGDGIPNWLKFNLGLNPMMQATTNSFGGIVWSSGKNVGGNNPANTIQIYAAAEVSFDTETGKTYQLQSISALGGTWENVGAPIPGTGETVSYVTPTRQDVQQFFRVVHTE